MVLFVNACVRRESRTKRLAEKLLGRLGNYEEINLNRADFAALTGESLEKREQYIAKRDFDHPMFDAAKQFASADDIVIAAPYWDAAFPAVLKIYLENIYVTGIVSQYGSDGRPEGLCKAGRLYYVTTAGGPYVPDFSYTYLSRLAKECFGIGETYLIKAEMLDVEGFVPETILAQAEAEIDTMFLKKGGKHI